MDKFKNIDDFKVGQVFVTKKGHKMEITDVRKDTVLEGTFIKHVSISLLMFFGIVRRVESGEGSVEVKTYSHRDSQSCKAYGWDHNLKWFKGYMRLDGKVGILNKIDKGGWTLKLEKNEK